MEVIGREEHQKRTSLSRRELTAQQPEQLLHVLHCFQEVVLITGHPGLSTFDQTASEAALQALSVL